VRAALERHLTSCYDPAYGRWPTHGRRAESTGVCTDVVRAYRALGVDLQRLVHEDMRRHFSAYPKQWGLRRPDCNIDHRRVPNLQTFFERRSAALPITGQAEDYRPGDLVTCTVPPDLPHIAIVVPPPDRGATPWIVHNIGQGPRYEDRLFEFSHTGHYRSSRGSLIRRALRPRFRPTDKIEPYLGSAFTASRSCSTATA
jgi:uncharacterized protein YijF (DUF1287 family)